MEYRVAVVGIIVEDEAATESLNSILHEYRDYIIGRMGIPYSKRKINVISVVVDAPQDEINALSGKLGRVEGIKTKTAYSDIINKE